MASEMSQAGLLFELAQRVLPHWKRITVASVVGGLIIGILAHRVAVPNYISEAVFLVQPQRVLEEFVGYLPLEEQVVFPPKPVTSFLPKPLSVEDYVLIFESNSLLQEVADTFNAQYPDQLGARGPLSRYDVKKMLTASSRLELKTPYDVQYLATLVLRSEAPTASMAKTLLETWVGIGQKWLQDLTYSARIQRSFQAVEEEYQRKLQELRDFDQERLEVHQANAQKLQALEQEWARKEADYQIESLRLLSERERDWETRLAGAPREELKPLQNERDTDIKSFQIERELGLEALRREADSACDVVRFESKLQEEQLQRQFETQNRTVQELAGSRQLANLAVAKVSDEFKLLSPPSTAEQRFRPTLSMFIFGAFVLSIFSLTVLYALSAVVGELCSRLETSSTR